MPMRITNMIVVASLMGALTACSTTGTPSGRGATAQAGTDAPIGAQVAVFQEIFRQNASAFKDEAQSYCVSTGPEDAKTIDPAVLSALSSNPKVKPRSACEIRPNGNGVFDRATGKQSLLFNVNTASCASATDCLIYGGYYEGNQSSQTNRYRAQLVNGTWAVVLDEMGPVS